MANWEAARMRSLAKWEELAGLARDHRAGELRESLLEGCALCAAATTEIENLGVPKVKMYTCDFCRGYLDLGGCQEPLHRILERLDESDWPGVENEIARVRETLGAARF